MGLINSKKSVQQQQAPVPDEVKFSHPNGIYPTCSWNLKVVRNLIGEKKLAPFYPGNEEKLSPEHDECPICLFYYPGGLNRTRCCKKGMCTECYLQIKKPNVSPAEATCPFCIRDKFAVEFLGPKSLEERQKEDEEEDKVVKLQQKMRDEEISRDKDREKEKQRQLTLSQQKGKERGEGDAQPPQQQPHTHVKSSGNHRKTDERRREDKENKKAQKNSGADRYDASEHVKYKASAEQGVGAELDIAPATLMASYPSMNQASSSPEKDLDDLMLMEAIRLSLMEKSTAPGGASSAKESGESESAAGGLATPRSGGAVRHSAQFPELFGFDQEGADFDSHIHATATDNNNTTSEVVSGGGVSGSGVSGVSGGGGGNSGVVSGGVVVAKSNKSKGKKRNDKSGKKEKEKEKGKDKGKGKEKKTPSSSSSSKQQHSNHQRGRAAVMTSSSSDSEKENDSEWTTTTTTTTSTNINSPNSAARAKRGRTASSPVPIEETPLGQTPQDN
eukprot:TRINITY_DN1679_c1_g1_i4.p1 TRINITY_DN1679_c1_g1~~TRINITY_DN1679_c1_g1_i4.p1  ORF type:complete len:502 (-),score=186.38 TRINITY_DN1679_c1_g1_i4:173-1678(-)